MTFIEHLSKAWVRNHSLVCVGLDPIPSRFPEGLAKDAEGIFPFNKAIVDATADLVCAYKPQVAHYAACGAEVALEETIDYIHGNYPGVPVILDAKRGDVGSTAKMYAVEVFDRYGADAVTVNPYLGRDAVQPFLEYADRGVIILCRTSNPGAGDLQDLDVKGMPLYEHVARTVAEDWNAAGNCLLVVGATWPEQLHRIRAAVGEMPFLVPGAGSQGGDIEQVVQQGQTPDGAGLIISSSRAVTYADSGPAFAQAAREVVAEMRDTINTYRRQTDGQ